MRNILNQPSYHCTTLFQFLDVPEHLIGSFQNHHVAAGTAGSSDRQNLDKKNSESHPDSVGTDVDGSGSFAYPHDVMSSEKIKAYNSSFIQSHNTVAGSSPFAAGSSNYQTEEGVETNDDYVVGVDISLENKKGFDSAASLKQKQDHWRRIFMNLRKGLKPREYTVNNNIFILPLATEL